MFEYVLLHFIKSLCKYTENIFKLLESMYKIVYLVFPVNSGDFNEQIDSVVKYWL